MAGWHLDTKMAQDIVARTMRIIDTNISIGCPRAGLSAAAIVNVLVNCTKNIAGTFTKGRVVDIDDAVARHLHGVRRGIIYRYGWKVKLSA